MAIIGEIRKHYWLLVAIIGVALLLFVLSDFSRKRAKQTNTIGVIAGEKISGVEFNKKVEENIELEKANSGKDNITSDESYKIRQRTWQTMLSEIVMNQQYDKLGVTVTVDEVFPVELTFQAGQTHEWHAKNSIILALPATAKTRLTLNGAIIPLPAPSNGSITVSIPGSPPK